MPGHRETENMTAPALVTNFFLPKDGGGGHRGKTSVVDLRVQKKGSVGKGVFSEESIF